MGHIENIVQLDVHVHERNAKELETNFIIEVPTKRAKTMENIYMCKQWFFPE